jgi:hypothetical protein
MWVMRLPFCTVSLGFQDLGVVGSRSISLDGSFWIFKPLQETNHRRLKPILRCIGRGRGYQWNSFRLALQHPKWEMGSMTRVFAGPCPNCRIGFGGDSQMRRVKGEAQNPTRSHRPMASSVIKSLPMPTPNSGGELSTSPFLDKHSERKVPSNECQHGFTPVRGFLHLRFTCSWLFIKRGVVLCFVFFLLLPHLTYFVSFLPHFNEAHPQICLQVKLNAP